MNLIVQGLSLEQFKSEWEAARQMTVDMLSSLNESELLFSLHDTCGPLWKQFRHIGRVQENYTEALKTQEVIFDLTGSFAESVSRDGLLRYFDRVEERFQLQLDNIDPEIRIDWFGKKDPLLLHLSRLLNHETLHHGQLILYIRALGKKFPESWAAWGEH